ncbi:hypothetical protein KIN20_002713 [Parelaphostrongylus tenuis]|uniref:Uncharacterized protein n=1 Tax=Parelaphostrongylus tenuis TaxID=148309 RepID=A0AAD5MH25_PARTN|nr:hypothetical protein KIN20_002713 [Parelaphostrongylus tenuis]
MFQSSAMDDDSKPLQKFRKPLYEFRVKTFSAPITHSELVIDRPVPVDGESHSLFKVSSKSWRLPPIRRGTISRLFL